MKRFLKRWSEILIGHPDQIPCPLAQSLHRLMIKASYKNIKRRLFWFIGDCQLRFNPWMRLSY